MCDTSETLLSSSVPYLRGRRRRYFQHHYPFHLPKHTVEHVSVTQISSDLLDPSRVLECVQYSCWDKKFDRELPTKCLAPIITHTSTCTWTQFLVNQSVTSVCGRILNLQVGAWHVHNIQNCQIGFQYWLYFFQIRWSCVALLHVKQGLTIRWCLSLVS